MAANPFAQYAQEESDNPFAQYSTEEVKPPLEDLRGTEEQRQQFIKQQGTLSTRARYGKGGLVKDVLLEAPRAAKEMLVDMPLTAAKKVGTDVKTIGQVVRGKVAGEDWDTALARGVREQEQFTPVNVGDTEPSATGEALSGAIEGGIRRTGEDVAGLSSYFGASPETQEAVKKGVEQVAGVGLNTAVLAGAGKGAVKTAKKLGPAAETVAAKISERTPSAKGPASGLPKVSIPKDDFLQRKLQRQSPAAIENKFQNSSESLMPADQQKTHVDPVKRQTDNAKSVTGIDELEQLAAEGRIHEHNARGEVVTDASGAPVPYEVGKGGLEGAYMPLKEGLKTVWSDEIQPVVEQSTAWGKTASMQPVAEMLEAKAAELGKSMGEPLRKRAEELKASEMTPSQIQARVTALNDLIYRGKEKLPVNDTIANNALKQEVGILNSILDDIVDTGLAEMGVSELKSRWGGLRQVFDQVANGLDTKVMKSSEKYTPQLTDAGAAAGLGLGLMGHPGYLVFGIPRAIQAGKKAYGKYRTNPDRAFETMIRTRRVQGNVPREVWKGQTPTTPRTVYDESTGKAIPAEGQGVSREGAAVGGGQPSVPSQKNLSLEGAVPTPAGSATPQPVALGSLLGRTPPSQANLGLEGAKPTVGQSVASVPQVDIGSLNISTPVATLSKVYEAAVRTGNWKVLQKIAKREGVTVEELVRKLEAAGGL